MNWNCQACFFTLISSYQPLEQWHLVHWPKGVNWFWKWRSHFLRSGCPSAAMINSMGAYLAKSVLHTPNCNWSFFSVPLIVDLLSTTYLTPHQTQSTALNEFFNDCRNGFQYTWSEDGSALMAMAKLLWTRIQLKGQLKDQGCPTSKDFIPMLTQSNELER